MPRGDILFTAVFMKTKGGYVGFVEELPGVNSSGRTLAEARDMLTQLAAVVFDEERHSSEWLIGGREALREPLLLPVRDTLG
jgi:predicted RNase H-like HicB family nuclease